MASRAPHGHIGGVSTAGGMSSSTGDFRISQTDRAQELVFLITRMV